MALERDLFAYLAELEPPQFVAQVAFPQIRAEALATLVQQLPAWGQAPDDPLYKATENFTYREYILRQLLNATYRAGLLAFANGADLDHLAAVHDVERQDGESDDELRVRVPVALRGLAVGTKAAFEANARRAGVTVTDVEVAYAVSGTGIAVTVYALGADRAALTEQDRLVIQAYLRHPERIHLGDTVTVAATTDRAYTIEAAITYDPRLNESVGLEEQIRRSVYAFIDSRTRSGVAVNRAGLIDALTVPSVETDPLYNVTLVAPAADAAGVVGQVPRCAKDETDVALTLTAAAT